MYFLPSVPGWITAIQLMAAGIACYMAIQAAIFVYYRQHQRLYLYFAAMCVIVAAELLVEARYDSAASVSGAAHLLQWQFAFILAFMPALYGFIAIYTEQPRFQVWQWGLMVAAAGLIVINFAVTPYSLRFSTLEQAAPIELPWGETLSRYIGAPSSWNILARVLFALIVVWAIIRASILFRYGRHRSALFLAGALAFMLFASFIGLLVDLGYVRFIFPGGLGALGLAIFMSAALALESRDNNLVLKTTAENLRKEISLHQQAEERIRHMAYHDYVTGLPNRVKLQELLADALARYPERGKKGALILLNLDDFRSINDVLGHDFGDRLLRLVAKRLLALGPEAGMPIHMGSDEFIMLLPDIGHDSDEAAAVAQRIARRHIEALTHPPFVIDSHSLTISASAGIALFPEEEESEADLLQRVDMALHRAKSYGRNAIQLYTSDLRAQMHEKLQLERDMRKGLERGEFLVYFQPKVNLAGNVVGAEALLRWRHPQREWIPPTLFVPIAESSGLIDRIGDWVLQQVCEQIKAWEQSLPSFQGHLSVNVSAWQFMQSNYKESVNRHLAASGINASRLTLEITESALLHNIDEAISTINSLRSHGLRFSIDDFGTGYASLSYLQRLPVDELKIDQAFVRNLGADLRDTHLVEMIINIGKCMGMQVVAEGVENESQRAALAALNCWALQGNHFAPPMDKEAFFSWVRAREEKMPIPMTR